MYMKERKICSVHMSVKYEGFCIFLVIPCGSHLIYSDWDRHWLSRDTDFASLIVILGCY